MYNERILPKLWRFSVFYKNSKEDLMTPQEKKQLQITACKVRMGIIEGTHAAKCGHPGGSLSAADVLT